MVLFVTCKSTPERKNGGTTEHGLGYRVVRELTQPFVNKNHHVFADNFFTSIPLACDFFFCCFFLCKVLILFIYLFILQQRYLQKEKKIHTVHYPTYKDIKYTTLKHYKSYTICSYLLVLYILSFFFLFFFFP